MPTRTKAEAKLIKSLPIKLSGELCNARTGRGYCKLPAGYDTEHLGKGRCKFHGGRAGRNITHGLYSRKLTSTIRQEFDKLIKNPVLIDLYGEFALMKTMLGNVLNNIQDRMNDDDSNWWIQRTKNGREISAEANTFLKVIDQITRMYDRIVNAEAKTQEHLSTRDVYIIINQIKVTMNDICGDCPIRVNIGNRLEEVRMPRVVTEIEDAKIASQ